MANIIDMPKLSDTMTVGTLIKWLKKEGDPVKSGDMLAEVETDKATMELESFFDGTLVKIFIAAGSQAPIGAALCAIGRPGETVSAPSGSGAPAASAAPAPAAPAAPAATPAASTSSAGGAAQAANGAQAIPAAAAPAEGSTGGAPGRIKISPLARKLAASKGVDPARVTGSGPGGRIVRADVLAFEKSGPSAQTAGAAGSGRQASAAGSTGSVFVPASAGRQDVPQPDRLIPLSNMRAVIARRTQESKVQAPHIYLEVEIDAAPLLELRAQLNSALEKEGVKLSVNDFILKACASALRRVPAVNSSWESDPSGAPGQGSIRQHGSVHVSFAVSIEEGLITPVIRDTAAKTIFAVSAEAKTLAKLARDKKLQPAQFTGGTFCVSNMGMLGIDRFCAIINQPNAAILAVGGTVKKPVVVDDQIVIGQRMSLTLSCDHRVLDGAIGAAYLSALREYLEKPALLLI